MVCLEELCENIVLLFLCERIRVCKCVNEIQKELFLPVPNSQLYNR